MAKTAKKIETKKDTMDAKVISTPATSIKGKNSKDTPAVPSPEEVQLKKDTLIQDFTEQLKDAVLVMDGAEVSRLQAYVIVGKTINAMRAELKSFKLKKETWEAIYENAGIASSTARLCRKLADNLEKISDCKSLAEARKIIYPPRTPEAEAGTDEGTEETGTEAGEKTSDIKRKQKILAELAKIDDKSILDEIIAEINRLKNA